MAAPASKGSTRRTTKNDLATKIETEAARLAGVSEILMHIGDSGGNIADALGVLEDTVNDVNRKICDIADELREARRG